MASNPDKALCRLIESLRIALSDERHSRKKQARCKLALYVSDLEHAANEKAANDAQFALVDYIADN